MGLLNDLFGGPEEEVEEKPSTRTDGRIYKSSPDDSVSGIPDYDERGIHLIELATLVFQAAIIIRGEPEDVTHNAIVAKRNALAMIEQLNKDSAPPPQ